MTKTEIAKLDEERNLASFVDLKLKEAMVAKAPLVKEWQTYMDAYENEFFENQSKPDYKTDSVSNYIFSTVETIRPIMLDNSPKFEVLSKTPGAEEKTYAIQFMLDSEFDRLKLKKKISKELINTLVMGTSIFYTPYNSYTKDTECIPISIFNFFPDPLATDIDDMEYGIYADYFHVNKLKQMFPDKADKLVGGNIDYSELVNENGESSKIDNQVLVAEMWLWDWTSVDVEEDMNGNKIEKQKRGIRVIHAAPKLGLILSDKPSPYKDNQMPFDVLKCYDVPNKFWGTGEAKRLLSPQTQMNELNNAIIDNAKSTANMPWIIDKNAGIPKGKITNRPGLVIRKNPGSEVRRDSPPGMPAYIQNIIENFKYDIEQISGVHDSLKGNSEKGVYTAQGILSLQEAAQARIRIKTNDLEIVLGNIANKIFNRNKQFWKESKYVSRLGEDGKQAFLLITKEILGEDYDIKIKAGSTTPTNKAAMFDLMIRLAQTPAEDGLPMVDRIAVMQYMPGFDAKAITERMAMVKEQVKQDQVNEEQHMSEHKETQSILQELAQQVQQINSELAKLVSERDQENDEAKLEQIREQAYNQGYEDLQAMQQEEQTQQQPQEIPNEIIDMIGELSDEELIALLEQHPELEEMIQQELQQNTNEPNAEIGTPQLMGLQGGI